MELARILALCFYDPCFYDAEVYCTGADCDAYQSLFTVRECVWAYVGVRAATPLD